MSSEISSLTAPAESRAAWSTRAAANEPPDSATHPWVTLLGLGGFVGSVVVLGPFHLAPVMQTICILIFTALPMVLADVFVLKVYRRATAGLAWSRAPSFSLQRSAVKILGLGGTLAILGLLYWIIPEYKAGSYALFFSLVKAAWPYLLLPTIAYIVIVDAYMVDPKDGYWQAGCALIGRYGEVDRASLGQYCLGWLVKGYFIPYITPIVSPDVNDIYTDAFVNGASGFSPFYDFAYNFVFTIDVVFVSLGYILTLRVTDTHIRSTEPTMFGWVVCIMCYPPFSQTFYAHYYPYESNTPYWGGWLSGHPFLYWCWGIAILACLFIYGWTSITFGCRFSNLTHRGILTNGPFALTKHPHYLFKNISWWLVIVPFISKGSLLDAIRACVMLAMFNSIYFMRARTEERHLSRDPTYVAYALWMNEHGIMRWLGRIAPIFRYKPPVPVLTHTQLATE